MNYFLAHMKITFKPLDL